MATENLIKVRNGVKVFSRMADNAGATALGVIDIMKQMADNGDATIRKINDCTDRVMASSSNNFIFDKKAFGEDKTPVCANRVLEIYIRWNDSSPAKHDFLISLSADMGSNQVVFAMGWDDDEVHTDWTDKVYVALNTVICKVIADMDDLIDDELNTTRKLSYENIIKNEINKKIAEHATTNPKDMVINWGDKGESKIESVDCEVTKLSPDTVDSYPVLEFNTSVSDSEGVPLYNVLVVVKDPKSKNADANFDIFFKVFSNGCYSDYIRIVSDLSYYYQADSTRGFNALKNVIVPAVSRIIPDLAILQNAIISQTIEKIGKGS
ncbi:MAG: hypothetical protein NC548_29650 [Lachnospiraceae bacterium]|nr:hypothetical protein [Lachnospiraceae bacterium]